MTRVRRCFVSPPGGPGGAPDLDPEEVHHLRRVLRVQVGDRLEGLDGSGSAQDLRVEGLADGGVQVSAVGAPRREPAPGAPGARLPRIEVAVGWPRAARGEAMVERLTQLGAAVVQPLAAAGRGAEPAPGGRRLERLAKIARGACKQSGRPWLPELRPAAPVADVAAAARRGTRVVLDPDAPTTLGEVLGDGDFTEEAPLVLFVGPEGGFTAQELGALEAAGAVRARLHPLVLRVETAAEAAVAVGVAHWHDRHHSRSRSDT